MTNIIKKVEGSINTAVGKIKQNADGRSFDKVSADQKKLGESQLIDSSKKDNLKNS